jgi:hypothetical protein
VDTDTSPDDLCDLVNNNSSAFGEHIIVEDNQLSRQRSDRGRFEWVDKLLL